MFVCANENLAVRNGQGSVHGLAADGIRRQALESRTGAQQAGLPVGTIDHLRTTREGSPALALSFRCQARC